MIELDIQNPTIFDTIPCDEDLQNWVDAALQKPFIQRNLSMVIRFVDLTEGEELNHTYRQKSGNKKATNVLSFPSMIDDFGISELQTLNEDQLHLGDLVLCEPVVRKEAVEQDKLLKNHWAHLVTHGTLHLQNYDHIHEKDALIMEQLEIDILDGLGFNNPYEDKTI